MTPIEPTGYLTKLMHQTSLLKEAVFSLSARVDSLEHCSNQQSILVDTLGDIMAEIEKSERTRTWEGSKDIED